ncbi:DNA-binding PadR family transcriptional regulator [Stackebrandtia albiflava]|uniref:DNA-binding PadR family transcriptional regulator n=1 Tax=Stackebrandtia albiflava TaxID=406432 RepID=A0A562V2S8_9ACTN|nr:PadR family transcriptional regulator [Stackebrandtia albiflava]TWJ12122.1 DNA-binding PadR family transcriptional regulator [Stackebrandtia albiflava]
MLELAVLGLLHESPMHGYELRKRLTTLLGAFRAAFSYGSLYPTLRRLRDAGWITQDAPDDTETAPPMTGKRGKISYRLTPEGKERFTELLTTTGPETYEDTGFGVHFAFFSRCEPAVRLRILEGRRRRIEERRERLRETVHRATERLDAYSQELQRHGLEAAEREVRWLNELIASEQAGRPPSVSYGDTEETTGTENPGDDTAPPPRHGQDSQ